MSTAYKEFSTIHDGKRTWHSMLMRSPTLRKILSTDNAMPTGAFWSAYKDLGDRVYDSRILDHQRQRPHDEREPIMLSDLRAEPRHLFGPFTKTKLWRQHRQCIYQSIMQLWENSPAVWDIGNYTGEVLPWTPTTPEEYSIFPSSGETKAIEESLADGSAYTYYEGGDLGLFEILAVQG